MSIDDQTPGSSPESETEERKLGIEWHPDALRPPFEWHVQLPPDWAVVETHPSRWKRQNERIVDDFFDGRRVPSRVRNALLRSLQDVVAAAQKNKILLTLIKPGVTDDGKIANTSMNLAFSSSAPRLASMAPIKRAFGSKDSYTERTTPAGNAYATTVVRRRQRDGDEYRDVLSVQGFFPMPATPWTLSVGLTTGIADQEEQLQDMVIRCVSSIRFGDVDESAPSLQAAELIGERPDIDDAVAMISHFVEK